MDKYLSLARERHDIYDKLHRDPRIDFPQGVFRHPAEDRKKFDQLTTKIEVERKELLGLIATYIYREGND
jgi:hypothetical protein